MKFTSLSYVGIIGVILIVTNIIELVTSYIASKKSLKDFIMEQKSSIAYSSGTVGILLIMIYCLSVWLE